MPGRKREYKSILTLLQLHLVPRNRTLLELDVCGGKACHGITVTPRRGREAGLRGFRASASLCAPELLGRPLGVGTEGVLRLLGSLSRPSSYFWPHFDELSSRLESVELSSNHEPFAGKHYLGCFAAGSA